MLAEVPDHVRDAALRCFGDGPGSDRSGTPVYVYDLTGLREHAASIRAALHRVECFYAAKANPDAEILRVVEPNVEGIEVSSGGELEHVRRILPGVRTAFGGPGKTDDELELALRLGVERIHVESPYELRRLAAIAGALGTTADVLLRVNLRPGVRGAALAMSGPFGMDEAAVDACVGLLGEMPRLRLRGFHAHLASGLDAPELLTVADGILAWVRSRAHVARRDGGTGAGYAPAPGDGGIEINVGGGMAVDYGAPSARFDWAAYGRGLAARSRPGERLRIEPGRAVTAYHGWYVTEVLDIKQTHGETFAVLHGGTQHLRTPVTKGHDQPFAVIPAGRAGRAPAAPAGAAGAGAAAVTGTVTLVGRLCTPKDVFARDITVDRLRVGDLVAFGLAGAYAWNISHHDFLMHPRPRFRYVGA